MAPPSASSRLSISNWPINRPRPAPNEERIAISLSRAVARASSILATLLQAISSNSPTAAATVYSVARNCPTRLSIQLMIWTLKFLG